MSSDPETLKKIINRICVGLKDGCYYIPCVVSMEDAHYVARTFRGMGWFVSCEEGAAIGSCLLIIAMDPPIE